MNELQNLLNNLVDTLGACERILRTPMPLAYAIHLKQLLLLYCLLLPFQVVDELRWWTAPAVALVSFTLFGIEAIGVEIENPFGTDPNDLPLDTICDTIERNIEDLISIEPHYRRSGSYGSSSNLGEQLN
jgi:putative membrane protein